MKRFLTLTKRQRLGPSAGNQEGLWTLNLDCWQKDAQGVPQHVGRLVVNSGNRHNQNFRTLAAQVEGELEPIPEGVYADLGPLLFASGRWEDYSKQFASIQSPISLTIYRRRAIEFHLDGNRAYAPGSAGCVVFRSAPDMRTFVGWASGDPNRFTSVWVDWGLGTVNFPAGLKLPAAA